MRLILRRRGFVNKIHKASKWYTISMVGQVHLARAARGVAIRATLWQVHVTESGIGDFRETHAPVTSHTAARNARTADFLGTLAGELHERVLDAHLLG